MKLHPFYEVAANAERLVKNGHTVNQQFNCAHCGVKQTMDVPNKFYKLGRCEEYGKETDIEKDGCNFMVLGSFDLVEDLLKVKP